MSVTFANLYRPHPKCSYKSFTCSPHFTRSCAADCANFASIDDTDFFRPRSANFWRNLYQLQCQPATRCVTIITRRVRGRVKEEPRAGRGSERERPMLLSGSYAVFPGGIFRFGPDESNDCHYYYCYSGDYYYYRYHYHHRVVTECSGRSRTISRYLFNNRGLLIFDLIL